MQLNEDNFDAQLLNDMEAQSIYEDRKKYHLDNLAITIESEIHFLIDKRLDLMKECGVPAKTDFYSEVGKEIWNTMNSCVKDYFGQIGKEDV